MIHVISIELEKDVAEQILAGLRAKKKLSFEYRQLVTAIKEALANDDA